MLYMNSYLKKYFLLTGSTLLLLSGFILLVDPQHIFRVVNVKGFNHKKPFMYLGGMRETKSIDLESGVFDTILLGTSRTNQGIKLGHSVFNDKSAYHAALDGANFYEIYKVFEFANKHNNLKTVIIGLDFFCFENGEKPSEAFYQSRFADKNIFISNFNDLVSPLMLQRSLKTVEANILLKSNATNQENIEEKENNNITYTKRFQGVNLKKKSNENFQYNSPERIVLLEKIIQEARKNNIELYLFISPVHARHLEDLRLSDLYETFEQWKRELVKITHKDSINNPDKEPIKIWNFSGYNSITTEEFYEKWYSDKNHYKEVLGDLVLDLMFSYPERPQNVPVDFGSVININNIEQHLQKIREDQKNYHRKFAKEIQELERLAKEKKAQEFSE